MIKYSKTLASIALSAMLLAGCGSSSSNDDEVAQETTTTPYLRVAVLNGDWSGVPDIAETIAQSIDQNDENQTLNYPTNWVVAGANAEKGETFETSDILAIPLGDTGQKGRVIELCNAAYAKMAIGTGRFHGPALPCEVSVHSDGNQTYIDILNPEGIFSIFFNDYNDTTGNMATMASTVKDEIKGMITNALTQASISYTDKSEAMGPKFTKSEIAQLTSPYIVYQYKMDGTTFVKGQDDKNIAKALIEILGDESAPTALIKDQLSDGASWRSARPEPLAIPNTFVVEACSPTYAKKATKLGSEYLTALPCEFAVYVDESDETNQTLSISILNPEFMFGTMFNGAIDSALANGKITEADATEFMSLPGIVKGDLIKIVEHVVAEHNLTKIN